MTMSLLRTATEKIIEGKWETNTDNYYKTKWMKYNNKNKETKKEKNKKKSKKQTKEKEQKVIEII